MTKITETSLAPSRTATKIFTPAIISEKSSVSGYAFSKRLKTKTGLKEEEFTKDVLEGKTSFPYKELAKTMGAVCAGGTTIGENFIEIDIDSLNPSMGSETDYIWMYFGRDCRVKLNGRSGKFDAGDTLKWDLNNISDWLEDYISSDLWDDIALVIDSGDGMKIKKITIVHSSQTILDWECSLWLDGSSLEPYTKLVLTAKILEQKFSQVNGSWVPQIHWAAREIGKTDGRKYGGKDLTEAWCSEFSSWCQRKALWDTPTGSIYTGSMDEYFAGISRSYKQSQLLSGEYKLGAGDYLHYEFPSGGHSGIFMEYISDATTPSGSTKIRTIEGNASSTVMVATRTFTDIYAVGNCQ